MQTPYGTVTSPIAIAVGEVTPIWMHTPPDFDQCDGSCTYNQCHMS